MAVLSEAQVIAQAQLLAQDTDPDSANQGLTAAQWLAICNESLYDMYGIVNAERVQFDSALVAAQTNGTIRNVATTLATWQDMLELQAQYGVSVSVASSGVATELVITADTAGAYANVAIGSVVTGHANIVAGTTVVSKASNNNKVTVSLAISAGGVPGGTVLTFTPSLTLQDINPPLERMAPEEIRFLQAKKGTTVVGAPTFVGYARQEGTGKFLLWLFPVPLFAATSAVVGAAGSTVLADYVTFGAYGHKFPTAMTGGSSAVDLTDDESYDLARVAAARGASLIGQDDAYVAQISAPLPQKFQTLVQGLTRYKVPRVEPSELTI